MTGAAVWARSRHVASVGDDVRVVVLDLGAPAGAQPRALVGTAAMIWNAVAEPASLDAVCRSVERQLSEPHQSLRAETAAFLKALVSEGLMTCSTPETPATAT